MVIHANELVKFIQKNLNNLNEKEKKEFEQILKNLKSADLITVKHLKSKLKKLYKSSNPTERASCKKPQTQYIEREVVYEVPKEKVDQRLVTAAAAARENARIANENLLNAKKVIDDLKKKIASKGKLDADEVEKLNQRVSRQTAEINKYQYEKKSIEGEKEACETEKATLIAKNQNLEYREKQIRSDLRNCNAQQTQLNNQLAQAKEKLNIATALKDELQQQLDQARQNAEKSKHNSNDQLNQLNQQIINLRNQLVQSQLAEAKIRNKQVETQTNLDNIKRQLRDLNSSSSGDKNNLEMLQRQKKECEDRLENLKDDNAKLTASNTELKNSADEWKKKYSDFKSKSTIKLAELLQAKEDLKKTIESNGETIANLNSDIANLNSLLKAEKGKYDALQKELKGDKQSTFSLINDLQKDHNRLLIDKDQTHNQAITELQNRFKKMEAERDAKDKQLNDITIRLAELNKKNTELDSNYVKLANTNKQLTDQLTQIDSDKAELLKKKVDLEKDVESLTNQVDTLNQQSQIKEKEMTGDRDQLENDLASLKKELKIKEAKLTKCDESLVSLNNENIRLVGLLDQNKLELKKYQTDLADSDKKIKEFCIKAKKIVKNTNLGTAVPIMGEWNDYFKEYVPVYNEAVNLKAFLSLSDCPFDFLEGINKLKDLVLDVHKKGSASYSTLITTIIDQIGRSPVTHKGQTIRKMIKEKKEPGEILNFIARNSDLVQREMAARQERKENKLKLVADIVNLKRLIEGETPSVYTDKITKVEKAKESIANKIENIKKDISILEKRPFLRQQQRKIADSYKTMLKESATLNHKKQYSNVDKIPEHIYGEANSQYDTTIQKINNEIERDNASLASLRIKEKETAAELQKYNAFLEGKSTIESHVINANNIIQKSIKANPQGANNEDLDDMKKELERNHSDLSDILNRLKDKKVDIKNFYPRISFGQETNKDIESEIQNWTAKLKEGKTNLAQEEAEYTKKVEEAKNKRLSDDINNVIARTQGEAKLFLKVYKKAFMKRKKLKESEGKKNHQSVTNEAKSFLNLATKQHRFLTEWNRKEAEKFKLDKVELPTPGDREPPLENLKEIIKFIENIKKGTVLENYKVNENDANDIENYVNANLQKKFDDPKKIKSGFNLNENKVFELFHTVDVNSEFYKHENPTNLYYYFLEMVGAVKTIVKLKVAPDRRLISTEGSGVTFGPLEGIVIKDGMITLGGDDDRHTISLDCFDDHFPKEYNRGKHRASLIPKNGNNYSSIYDASNEVVYDSIKSDISTISTGGTVCLSGSGSSGSGKSYTLSESDSALVFQAIRELLNYKTFTKLEISGFEQYCRLNINHPEKKLKEILNGDAKKDLLQENIYKFTENGREEIKDRFSFEELPTLIQIEKGGDINRSVRSIRELFDEIKNYRKRGSNNLPKTIRPTLNNKESSRSHKFMELKFHFKQGGKTFTGRLIEIDMGGVENGRQMLEDIFNKNSELTKFWFDKMLNKTPIEIAELYETKKLALWKGKFGVFKEKGEFGNIGSILEILKNVDQKEIHKLLCLSLLVPFVDILGAGKGSSTPKEIDAVIGYNWPGVENYKVKGEHVVKMIDLSKNFLTFVLNLIPKLGDVGISRDRIQSFFTALDNAKTNPQGDLDKRYSNYRNKFYSLLKAYNDNMNVIENIMKISDSIFQPFLDSYGILENIASRGQYYASRQEFSYIGYNKPYKNIFNREYDPLISIFSKGRRGNPESLAQQTLTFGLFDSINSLNKEDPTRFIEIATISGGKQTKPGGKHPDPWKYPKLACGTLTQSALISAQQCMTDNWCGSGKSPAKSAAAQGGIWDNIVRRLTQSTNGYRGGRFSPPKLTYAGGAVHGAAITDPGGMRPEPFRRSDKLPEFSNNISPFIATGALTMPFIMQRINLLICLLIVLIVVLITVTVKVYKCSRPRIRNRRIIRQIK